MHWCSEQDIAVSRHRSIVDKEKFLSMRIKRLQAISELLKLSSGYIQCQLKAIIPQWWSKQHELTYQSLNNTWEHSVYCRDSIGIQLGRLSTQIGDLTLAAVQLKTNGKEVLFVQNLRQKRYQTLSSLLTACMIGLIVSANASVPSTFIYISLFEF